MVPARLTAAATGLVLFLVSGCGDDTPPSDRPHVLVVTIDTLRADHLNEEVMPHLDAFAGSAFVDRAARSHVPLTLPAHASLLTGQRPPALGLHDNTPFALSTESTTLAERCQEVGYRTFAVLAGQPLAHGCGLEQGYESYDAPAASSSGQLAFVERTADVVTDAALAVLTHADAGPLHLWVHYFDPHFPYTPPAEYATGPTTRERYAGEARFVDDQLSRLLRAIQSTERSWIVAITSDHGEGLGDHGERTHGYHVFDSTLAVPLVLGRVAGSSISAPPLAPRGGHATRHIDLVPTLLGWLELPASGPMDGVNLLTEPPPEFSYVEALAANLHFGWAQITGLRCAAGTWVHAGAAGEVRDEGIQHLDAGSWWIPADPAAPPPSNEDRDRWTDALVQARRESSTSLEPGVQSLQAVGYLSGAATPGRLLPVRENAALPSPLTRITTLEENLQAIALLTRDLVAAAAALDFALRSDPDNPMLLFHRGRAGIKLAEERGQPGQLRGAIQHLERVLKLQPGHFAADSLLIKAWAYGGEHDRAIARARQIDRSRPSAETARLLGGLLSQRRSLLPPVRANPHYDLAAAFTALVTSCERDPQQAALRERIFRELQRHEDNSWAVALIERLQRTEHERSNGS